MSNVKNTFTFKKIYEIIIIMKEILIKAFIKPYLKLIKFYTLYLNPYKYNLDNYKNYFLSAYPKKENVRLEQAKEIIFVFWTGNNELTENRKVGLNSLIDNAGIEIKLITPKNLNDYILPEYPIHKGYDYLSLIQKSDYLRCYFMLHYGGGYADIKPCLCSWKKLFEKLNANNLKWALGVREKFMGSVPKIEGRIGEDLKMYYNYLISNGGFIYKANSPICKEWMKEIHKRMDFYLPELKKNPGGIYDENNYPIPWAYLAGHIMHPLILKYNEKVIYSDKDLFSLKNYR